MNAPANHDILNFIGFFFAGLTVNLTPCVYPMLAVTASLFKPKPELREDLRHSFARALAYFLGIVFTYCALGYFAASTGKLFGSALQSQWVQGVVGLFMLGLALSMFGFFHLRIPAGILSHLGKFRKADYPGLFASGMLVGVFAAPCIGPPVLALLAAVADNGNPQYGFTAFLTFSSGLGLPYLLLGTFENLIVKLPKTGTWLIWMQRFFGVVLLGFSFFYLSVAFGPHSIKKNRDSIWKPYSVEAVQGALAAHTPVIIDLFAEWCLSCYELEDQVFAKPAVKAELAKAVTLRVDMTDVNTPENRQFGEQYEIIGLPTVIFLGPDGKEIREARVEGVSSLKDFLKSLDMQQKSFGVTPVKEGPMSDAQSNRVRIFDAASQTYKVVDKVVKSDEEWKKILTPEQLRVTRGHGTERAFCALPTKHTKGIYKCVGCGTDLFLVGNKFESGTGWPSFWQPLDEANVGTQVDKQFGMVRTEVHCARCNGHLGHVFDDGPPPTGKRYCINSVALKFEEA